jgi:hypothetical protein
MEYVSHLSSKIRLESSDASVCLSNNVLSFRILHLVRIWLLDDLPPYSRGLLKYVFSSLHNLCRKPTVDAQYTGEKLKILIDQRWTGLLATVSIILEIKWQHHKDARWNCIYLCIWHRYETWGHRLIESSVRAVLYHAVYKMTVVYMAVFQLSLHLCTCCSSIGLIACVAQLKEVGKRSLCSLYVMHVYLSLYHVSKCSLSLAEPYHMSMCKCTWRMKLILIHLHYTKG